MLIQLTYASRATDRLGPTDIKEILAASRRNNTPLGITGALCIHNGIFLQILEGDRQAVSTLYHRILTTRGTPTPRCSTSRRSPRAASAAGRWACCPHWKKTATCS